MVVLPPVDEPQELNTNYILWWNNLALDLSRITINLQGPQSNPASASRALGIFHLAIHDAYFAILPSAGISTYLTPNGDAAWRLPSLPAIKNRDVAQEAVNGAANTVLRQLYTTRSPSVSNTATDQLTQFIQQGLNTIPTSAFQTLSDGYRFGVQVGQAILNLLDIQPGEIGFDQDSFRPPGQLNNPVRYGFDDDPINPIREVPIDINNPSGPTRAIRVYTAPFYGQTAKRLASQYSINGAPTEHILGDPPVGFGVNNVDQYNFAFQEVYRQGGAQALDTTIRTPAQTVQGFYWAYDGVNLLGTPIRNYNLILRTIAWSRKPAGTTTSDAVNADFVRLFALANAALADAGIFAWKEKYNFQFIRPLQGIRQDFAFGNPLADPFWLTLGAPDTNTFGFPFKPPFPSYPSGHATFGGAFFQMVRLYYRARDNLTFPIDGPDDIGFTHVSEELNGISRDLRQPYDPNRPITDQQGMVRTKVPRTFTSLWDAIFDNGLSRVFLGVHWGFDAFAAADVIGPGTSAAAGVFNYKAASTIRYQTLGPRSDRPGQLLPIGGVPLGIGIANDIFGGGLKPTPPELQPNGLFPGGPPSLQGLPAGATKKIAVLQDGDGAGRDAVGNGEAQNGLNGTSD